MFVESHRNMFNIKRAKVSILFFLVLCIAILNSCSSGKGFGVGNLSKEEKTALKEFNSRKASESGGGSSTSSPATAKVKKPLFFMKWFSVKPDGPPGGNSTFKQALNIQNKSVKKRMKKNARKARKQTWRKY